MNYKLMPEANVVIQRLRIQRKNPGYQFPSVSIFMSFNPKMGMKSKLTFSLSKATDKAISELREKYSGEMSLLVIHKLKAIIKSLDFNTHKRSLAIFVSPVFEKIYYLNIDLEEKVVVNKSLQITDLVYSKKQHPQFHILLLTEKGSRIYLNDTNSFINITPEGFKFKNATQKDFAEQVACLQDAEMEKETAIEKFLHHTDHSLEIVLKDDAVPVFVIGAEKLAEQFKNITKNNEAVIEYVYGDFEKCSLEDLKRLLKAHISDWQKIKQKHLLHLLKEAAIKNQLSFGIEDVRRQAINRRGRLLLLERKYLYGTGTYESNTQDTEIRPYNKFSCIKNPIDETIEKVLENGGDVELVNNGFLKEYRQIALIKDY